MARRLCTGPQFKGNEGWKNQNQFGGTRPNSVDRKETVKQPPGDGQATAVEGKAGPWNPEETEHEASHHEYPEYSTVKRIRDLYGKRRREKKKDIWHGTENQTYTNHEKQNQIRIKNRMGRKPKKDLVDAVSVENEDKN